MKKYIITDEKGNKYISSDIYSFINKIKDGKEINLFDKNKILNEVDRILTSHKMYDKNVNEISFALMKSELFNVYEEGTRVDSIWFNTPAIEIDCTSSGAKSAVTRLMRKEGYETMLYGSFSVLVYKWDYKKIDSMTNLRSKK